ncbi:MAG: tyrosine-protein phosphatase [Thiocapsa sp.]|nr:tyrosine-protein phosphatase [Thiocapsa sp.]MCG6897309.1 tyrosine-protein phosphatase [Thiocapsa sp.]
MRLTSGGRFAGYGFYLLEGKPVIDGFVGAGGDRAIAEAVFGVKAEYLEASFDEMQKRYGAIKRDFSEGLGIDAAGQNALRVLYAEDVTSAQRGKSK